MTFYLKAALATTFILSIYPVVGMTQKHYARWRKYQNKYKNRCIIEGTLIDLRFENKVEEYHPLLEISYQKLVDKPRGDVWSDRIVKYQEKPEETIYIKDNEGNYTELFIEEYCPIEMRHCIESHSPTRIEKTEYITRDDRVFVLGDRYEKYLSVFAIGSKEFVQRMDKRDY